MYRARLIYVIYYVAVAAYAPYLQLYYGGLGIDVAGVGALSALSSATAMVGAPLWGAIHDRMPTSRWLVPFAGALAAGSGMAMGLVGDSLLLIPAVAGFALGLTGVGPMLDVRVLHMTGSDRSRYAGVRVFGSIGFIIATPFIGFAIHQEYVRLFVFFVPIIFFAAVCSLLLPARSTAVRSAGLMRSPGIVLGHRPIAIFLLAALVAWISIAMQSPFLSLYIRSLGGSTDQVGYVWSCQALLEIPSMVFFPALARRFGNERLMVAGMAILTARQAANAILTTPTIIIGFSLLQGLGYGLLLVGGIAYVSQQAPRGTAATAQGILNAVTFSLASIIGAGIGGQIGNLVSIRTLFGMSAVLGAISVGLLAMAVLPGSTERLRRSRAAATLAPAPAHTPSPEPALTPEPALDLAPSPAPSPEPGAFAS